MMNYFDLISQVCISAVLVTVTMCIMLIMISATRRVIRGLNTPKQAKKVEGKHWEKRKNIEVKKDDEKEKKEA